jgi:hypothetical protein
VFTFLKRWVYIDLDLMSFFKRCAIRLLTGTKRFFMITKFPIASRPFFGSFSDNWRSRHSASLGYSIKGRSLIARVVLGPVYVQGGQVSDWEESQMLAALAVSESSAALQ